MSKPPRNRRRPARIPLICGCILLGLVGSAFHVASALGSAALVVNEPGFFPAQIGLFYTASPGETNQLAIDQSKLGSYTIADEGTTINAGSGCHSVDPHRVTCSAERIIVDLRASSGNDNLVMSLVKNNSCVGGTAAPGFARIFGGPGVESMRLGLKGPVKPAPGFTAAGTFCGTYVVQGGCTDTIVGSPDSDIIQGGLGDNRIIGGGGNDVIAAGGTGTNDLQGGSGADFILGDTLQSFNFGVLGDLLQPFSCPRRPADHDVLRAGPGPALLAPGRRPTLILGGGGRDTLLYAAPATLTGRHGGPPPVSILRDGRYDSGPPGYRDNVGPGISTVISVGSGALSLADSLALKGGTYSIVGGTSTNAAVYFLSSQGTVNAQIGKFSGSSFTVGDATPGSNITDLRPTGGGIGGCAQHRSVTRAGRVASGTTAIPAFRSIRTFLATVLRSRRHRRGARHANTSQGAPDRRFRVVGLASTATPVTNATWSTTDMCAATLTRVRAGTVRLYVLGLRRTVILRRGQSFVARLPSARHATALPPQAAAGRPGR